MILAGETGFDCPRALWRERKGSEHDEDGIGRIWGEPGADVVDDDWLVCEDILVFGGHSTLGEGDGMMGAVVVGSYSSCCCAHGTVLLRERRVAASVGGPPRS